MKEVNTNHIYIYPIYIDAGGRILEFSDFVFKSGQDSKRGLRDASGQTTVSESQTYENRLKHSTLVP